MCCHTYMFAFYLILFYELIEKKQRDKKEEYCAQIIKFYIILKYFFSIAQCFRISTSFDVVFVNHL